VNSHGKDRVVKDDDGEGRVQGRVEEVKFKVLRQHESISGVEMVMGNEEVSRRISNF